jgi:hypothetical protein
MKRSRKRKSWPEPAREALFDLVIVKRIVTRKRPRYKSLTMHTKKSSRQRWHEVLSLSIKASSGSWRGTLQKSRMAYASNSMSSDEATTVNGSKISTPAPSTSIHWKAYPRVKAMV